VDADGAAEDADSEAAPGPQAAGGHAVQADDPVAVGRRASSWTMVCPIDIEARFAIPPIRSIARASR
jgi:hypothetical protein